MWENTVTTNTTNAYIDEETQRQIDAVKSFLKNTPGYVQNEKNDIALVDWLEKRSMHLTEENLRKAYEALFNWEQEFGLSSQDYWIQMHLLQLEMLKKSLMHPLVLSVSEKKTVATVEPPCYTGTEIVPTETDRRIKDDE